MRIAKALCILSLCTVVNAQQGNPRQVIESSEALVAALESSFDFAVAQYIPDYGLQINAQLSGLDIDSQAIIDTTANVLVGLSATVEGMQQGDYISVSYSLSNYEEQAYFTARIIPNQADSFEVFINGTAQE